MKLTSKDIRHVAELARMEVSDADVETYISELGRILGYMEKLAELPTADVPPTASVGVDALPLRPDEERAGFAPGQVLENAPEVCEGHFRVPRVVEG
ncbi:MAG: Asp-tRNA(Asn)/Glu-tRNA(Gln) amidotransferase subunit GatC [Candidatus Eisenbacteria bacterium]|nr:Asp-tRNA(Asn)/Glu-tRNA(Gln) amidotransferase subunit GatC [Candidatus Eisenbacteria bacterium]